MNIIQDVIGVNMLRKYLVDKDYVAYDCETTGLTKRHEVIGYSVCADEDESFYVILAKWNRETQALDYLRDNVPASKELLNDLTTKSLIMHNAVYDCMMAEAYFGVRLIDALHTDTMVLAHLLDENRRIGLKPLTSMLFGEHSTDEEKEMKTSIVTNGGQVTKDVYELYKGDAELIAKYGAKDALLTFKLFQTLVPQLFEQGLDKFFYEDECMPLLKGPTYELNTTGLQVDNQALITTKKTLEAECAAAKAFIYSEITPHIKDKYPGTKKTNTFNIGASQQLSWLIFGKLGLEFGTLTKGGKEACKALGMKVPYTYAAKKSFIATVEGQLGMTLAPEGLVNGKKVRAKKVKAPWAYIACDKKTLAKLSSKQEWIKRLLEYQAKNKLLNTYVDGIASRINYGVIQPGFAQTGTKTGRYSSSNPNFQNLPRGDKRIKAFIVARPGKVFVGADYSQLEPRVFAYYSKDERLAKAFNTSDDFYSTIGIDVYDKHECSATKEGPTAFAVMYPKLRDETKVIALSSVYGTTAFKLASALNKSVDDTQEIITNYFEKFPSLKDMIENAHKTVKKQGFVTNIFGRPRRIPEAKTLDKIYGTRDPDELPYEARKLLNMAVNAPIQGTAGSIVNRASIRMHQLKTEHCPSARLVLQVHDSLVYEVDAQEAETTSLLLQESMENTVTLEGIPLQAIPKIAPNLAEV